MLPTSALLAIVLQTSTANLPPAPAPQPAAEQAAAEASGHLKPPVLLLQVDPEFTEAARRKNLSGDVQMKVMVDIAGKATRMTILHSPGLDLNQAAIAAVKQYRWRPAQRDGQPVPMEIPVTVNFQIF